MLNIVIPMAGRGSRFANAGYKMPKPLIDIHGEYMISYVTKNLRPSQEYRFIYLCLQEHIETYNLKEELRLLEPNSIIIPIKEVTEGAACTVLLAKDYINNDNSLMIANSDQYVDISIDDYLSKADQPLCDGLIMTMSASDKKWSFINFDKDNRVTMVKEKEVISNEATVGIYNFTKGSDFVRYAEKMIKENQRVNGEFYVAPVYNAMIFDNKKIFFYNIGSVGNGMYGLGTPEDLNEFLKLELFKNNR